MINEKEPPLLIAGQFPPPVHGFSYITQKMTELLSEKYDTTIIDLVPHTNNGTGKKGPLYHIKRLFLALKGVGVTIAHISKAGKAPLYIACEGGSGLIYTILLAIAGRFTGRSIFLHHHSFNYIDHKIFLMSLLQRILGEQVVHVFLCPLMGSKLANRYNRDIRGLVISNSAFVNEAPVPVRESKERGTLTLGLLSNLNEEKGLSLFIETIERALEAGLNIRGILAGPSVSEKDRITIQEAQKRLGYNLDYRGPVYDQDKDKFFRDVDVFLFPTQYVNEAQPTVIAEALSYGIPILSYERGCICDQVGDCGSVFEKEKNFAEMAVKWLKEKTGNIQSLNNLKHYSRNTFISDKINALETARNLLQYKTTLFKSNEII